MALERIVKMTFKQEYCAQFETYFDEIKDQVALQSGCYGVKLLKDLDPNSGVYFTYSTWVDEVYLNTYRETELFKSVWSTVKAWFDAKPEAWSTVIMTEVNAAELL